MTQRHPIQNDRIMHVTTNTYYREPFFADPAYAREAIETLYRVQALRPFFLYAFVIMPDHCHFLLKIPAPETISRIMNVYKSGLSHNIQTAPLWQPRFDLRLVDNPSAVRQYIHWNPVKKGLVEEPSDYPWSSACGKWDVSEWEMSL